MINFSETLIRASSVGYLMVDPQSKFDKEAGLLSKTAEQGLADPVRDWKLRVERRLIDFRHRGVFD